MGGDSNPRFYHAPLSNESTYENGREKTSLNIGGCYAF